MRAVKGRWTAVLAAAVAGIVAVIPAAGAAGATCPGAGQQPVLVAEVPNTQFEGVTVDADGRLYATDLRSGRIYRFDAPGEDPEVLATVPGGLDAPLPLGANGGALAWTPDGTLLVGYGSQPWFGDVTRNGSIAKVDSDTGKLTPFVTGLSSANGMAVAHDGVIYATNDFGTLVGRVTPDGRVDPDWARLPSANGAALDSANRYLYVGRTFVNPGVSRIPLADPGKPESLVTYTGLDSANTPDGVTLDSLDRPVVPLNLPGTIVRVTGPEQTCELGGGLPTSSVLTYGRGSSGFAKGKLYRAGFDGRIYEIPGGYDPDAEALHP